MANMNSKVKQLINIELKKRNKKIRNGNAIDALLRSLSPRLYELKEVLTGSKKALEIEKQKLTLEKILDLIIAIDDKLSGKDISNIDKGLKILIRNVVSGRDITGFQGKTSNQAVRKIFEKPVDVTIKDAHAQRDITAVKLDVDEEMPIKGPLKSETDLGKVETNPQLGKITLCKNFKKHE